MNINSSTGGYRVVKTETVILYSYESDFTIDVKTDDSFQFKIVFNFMTDTNEELHVERVVDDTNVVKIVNFKCYNFNSGMGTGTVRPLPIATIAGKEWLIHFWSYLMGEKPARKVEYTILEKAGEIE